MAASKCGSCGNGTFGIQTQSPLGSQYQFNYVQCTECGVVAGIVDFFNAGVLINNLAEQLKGFQLSMEQRLARVDAALAASMQKR